MYFPVLQNLTFAENSIHLPTMPSGNITFPARKEIMGRTVDERAKFLKSVQGLGPTPSLTFTHHTTNQDLWLEETVTDQRETIEKQNSKISELEEKYQSQVRKKFRSLSQYINLSKTSELEEKSQSQDRKIALSSQLEDLSILSLSE